MDEGSAEPGIRLRAAWVERFRTPSPKLEETLAAPAAIY